MSGRKPRGARTRGWSAEYEALSSLGIDAVWLSPFYPSALADGGYDVDDYRDVDPRLGSLADIDELIARLHERSIRLIIDIVPNHSSNRHTWFREALAAPRGSAARARYIFRDGRGPTGELPPSDWVPHFGGSAWTRVPDGQWYRHLFSPQQPDFNWDHPDVHAEFLRTLAFWADRGVDGFRIDVAHTLKKDLSEPLRSKPTVADDATPEDGTDPLFDRDDVHEIYREWRALFNTYVPPLSAVAEAWVPASRRHRYADPAGLGQAFNFDLLRAPFEAEAFRRIIDNNLSLAAEAGSSSTWVLSNHDVIRHTSRYGLPTGTDQDLWLLSDGHLPHENVTAGLTRARAATLLILALPGSTYLYQGEELGLREVADPDTGDLQDPIWQRSGHTEKGRDGCRVPIPRNAVEPDFGFGGTPHLPMPTWFAPFAVDVEQSDPDSTLSFYRRALAARDAFDRDAILQWLHSPEGTLRFRRGNIGVVINMTSEPVAFPSGETIISSGEISDTEIPPATTLWYRIEE